MKKDKTVKVNLSLLDLEIIAEGLVESENVVHILGNDEYIERYNYLAEHIGDQMVKFYKMRQKAKRRHFRYLKLRYGIWK